MYTECREWRSDNDGYLVPNVSCHVMICFRVYSNWTVLYINIYQVHIFLNLSIRELTHTHTITYVRICIYIYIYCETRFTLVVRERSKHCPPACEAATRQLCFGTTTTLSSAEKESAGAHSEGSLSTRIGLCRSVQKLMPTRFTGESPKIPNEVCS